MRSHSRTRSRSPSTSSKSQYEGIRIEHQCSSGERMPVINVDHFSTNRAALGAPASWFVLAWPAVPTRAGVGWSAPTQPATARFPPGARQTAEKAVFVCRNLHTTNKDERMSGLMIAYQVMTRSNTEVGKQAYILVICSWVSVEAGCQLCGVWRLYHQMKLLLRQGRRPH